VAALWTGALNPLQLEEPEFFNRSVDYVYALESAPPLGYQLPEAPVKLRARTGALVDTAGKPVAVRYVLADSSTAIRGKRLQSDPLSGLTLYRAQGPAAVRALALGRFGDGWSGPEVDFTRYGCRPGRLL